MSSPSDTPSPNNFHILVVDDEDHVCRTLCRAIKKEKYQVTGVESGEKALKFLQKTPIDLLLTDIMMPGINGWQLLRLVKEHFSHIPVIVFTGYLNEEAIAKLESEQADGYLTKPIDQDRLLLALKALLLPQNLGRPAEVVVVDANSNSLRTTEQALNTRGLYVHPFRDAHKASLHIRSTPPDLIVTELTLPGTSGLDLCRTLRSNPTTAHIPVLMLASQPAKEDVIKAIQMGVKEIVTKPIDATILGDRAIETLQKKRIET